MNIDKIAEIEDQSRRSAESWAPAWHAWYEGVAKHFPKGSGVEVGVAYGGHLVFLREQMPHVRLHGVDSVVLSLPTISENADDLFVGVVLLKE